MTPTRLKHWLVAGNVLVGALLLAAVALPLRDSRAVQLERATDATTNLVRTLAQTIEADVTRLDLALQSVVAAGPAMAAEHLQTLRLWLPEAAALRLTDARGIEVDTAGTVDHGQRAFFIQASQAAPDAGATLSGPWQRTPQGPWLITLARAVRHADGRLAGVIHGELQADQLGRRFEGVDVGTDGAIALRTTGLALLARQTSRGPATDGIGTATVSAALKDALRANPRSGAYIAVVVSDGIERSNAYQQVGAYPLLVLAGLGTAEYLVAWKQYATQTGALAALLLLSLVAASVLIHRGWARHAAARAELAAQSHRYRTLLLTANDGIHLLDLDGRLVECNLAFATMLGRRPEELTGCLMAAWDAHYEAAQLDAWLAGFKPGKKRRSTSSFRRADGTLFDVEIHSAAMEIDGRTLVLCAARDVTERQTQQRRLEEALAERETLLREVYHRVKNNLQMVQSLLSLQQRALPDGPAREALAESSQRVRAMALVHEQLYQTQSLAAVDLRSYTLELLKRLGDAVGARHRSVVLHCDIAAGHEVVLDLAVPYGLLVTELVLNSLKHAFGEGGGVVRVAIEPLAAPGGQPGLQLTVSDDGQGLAADFELEQASRLGSIGLQLAASLAAQLGGELKAMPTTRGAAFAAVLTRLIA